LNEQERKSNNLDEQERKPDNKNNLMIIIIGVLIICIGILAFVLIQNKNSSEFTNNTGIGMESNIVLGSSSKSLEEQLAEMQQKVDEGQVGVDMSTSISIKSGETKADLLIENPARNTKSFVVSICLSDTGEEIYKSGLIPPNSYIETANFNKVLKAGTYSAVAYFTTYLPDGTEDGAVGVNITINVLN
jgi:flagellar basal body-associated protein FliL